LESLAQNKSTELKKALKASKSIFLKASKCKLVLVLLDFKGNADQKKMDLMLPFKKEAEAKAAYKKLKQTKLHALNKTALCLYELDGQTHVRCTQILGNAKEAKLQPALAELLSLFKLELSLAFALEEEEEEDADTEGEEKAPSVSLPQLLIVAQNLQKEIQDFKKLGLAERQVQQSELRAKLHDFLADLEFLDSVPPKLAAFAEQLRFFEAQDLATKSSPDLSQDLAQLRHFLSLLQNFSV
jgi:hypothetical protein